MYVHQVVPNETKIQKRNHYELYKNFFRFEKLFKLE